MPNPTRLTALSLGGVILGLLAVGLVSGTPVRHLIQVLPAAAALVLVLRHAACALYAALPVFALWLLIMMAIWLFLTGLAKLVSGHFTPAEIVLTFVIGGSCFCGLCQIFRAQPAASAARGAIWLMAFAALQMAAIWLSLRPTLANI